LCAEAVNRDEARARGGRGGGEDQSAEQHGPEEMRNNPAKPYACTIGASRCRSLWSAPA
jgi:hypothetical protein